MAEDDSIIEGTGGGDIATTGDRIDAEDRTEYKFPDFAIGTWSVSSETQTYLDNLAKSSMFVCY